MSLSTLTLGSNTLTPTFDKDVTSYSANITTATTSVTATPSCVGATVTKRLNGSEVTGNTVTWTSDTDTLEIIVSEGGESKTYTVTVTHT